MNRKKNRISTAIGLLVMLCITAAAWQLPGVMYSFSDRAAFAKREEIHMELRQYEKEGSFFEQLYSMALCRKGVSSMQSVRMEDETMDKEELTHVIQGELTKMTAAGILEDTCVVQFQDLVSCELYMSYLNGWNKKQTRDGVAFWKVHFQNQTQENWYDIEVIIDMEYHKIYDIIVKNALVQEMVQDFDTSNSKNKKYKAKNYDEDRWLFLDAMIYQYYGFNDHDFNIGTEVGYETSAATVDGALEEYLYESRKEIKEIVYQLWGNLYFGGEKGENGYRLAFAKEYGYGEDGEAMLHIGIVGLHQILQL